MAISVDSLGNKLDDEHIFTYEREAEVDYMFGMDTKYITPEQIKALQEGKKLWFSDGEYAHVIMMEDKDIAKNN